MTRSNSTAAAVRRSGSRAVAALTLLSVSPSIRLSAQTIDTIVVINHNVFDLQQDGDAAGFLARLANSLHVRTRPAVIRRALLVNPGDRYDSARVAESERALRALNVFSRVRVDTVRLDGGGRLALRVETTDGWSTKPQLGYSSQGGDVTWLAGLVEDNLLGTATSLVTVYNKTPDRESVDLQYLNPHFVARRGRLAAQYTDKSDGRRGLWAVGVPFYETGARRAVVVDGEAASERVLVFRDGVPDTTRAPNGALHRRALRLSVTGGVAPRATSRSYLRLWLGGQWRREDFDTVPPVVRSTFGTVGSGVDIGHARFQVLERFNSFARREDVNLSQLLHLGVWAAPRAWGYPSARAGVGPEVGGQASVLWNRGFAVLRGWANGVYGAAGLDSGRVSGSATLASQNVPRHTLIVHFEGAGLRRANPGAEFDLWLAQKGPRVFGIHQFTGTRMVWLAVEDRILLVDEAWGLVGLGVAPFVDYGGAWYGIEPARLGGDVGLSLRIGPTRAARGDVAELAIGYRFGDGFRGSRWGFSIRKGLAF